MPEKLKVIGGYALGFVLLVGVIAIPAIFIAGSAVVANYALPYLFGIGWIVLALDLVILLPLAIFRRFRSFAGSGLFISSYLFGLTAWLLSLLATWELWGGWAVAIGVLFFGGTIVPIALLATIFKGVWTIFFAILGLLAVTFGARLGGAVIIGAA